MLTISDRRADPGRRRQGARRRYPRVRLALDGYYTGEQRTLIGRCRDLCIRGVFVATPVPDAAGARALLRLAVPGSNRLLRLPARVCWSSEGGAAGPRGMGLRFESLEGWQLKRLASVVIRRAGLSALGLSDLGKGRCERHGPWIRRKP
ncbi:MAG: PilZ domain-containing protein [Deltaproteobacteria bacterium]|nr:PilZ domain-containing protein [Deltaproteobacteria bacterium]